MKKVADICVEAGSEDKLNNFEKDLSTIKQEVKTLALKFPVPGI
jgi:hypothetical protein